MDNEPYRDLTHHEARDALAGWLRQAGAHVLTELPLSSGRRADVVLFATTGEIHIFEVKDYIADSLIDRAWAKYREHCNYLWVASPQIRVRAIAADRWPATWANAHDRAGLAYIAREGVQVLRRPAYHQMTPALCDYMWRQRRTPCSEGEAIPV